MSGGRDSLDAGLAQLHQELMRALPLPTTPRPLSDADVLARLRESADPAKEPA